MYHLGDTQGLSIYLLVLVLFLCLKNILSLYCLSGRNSLKYMCEKLHAFRSPLLELATSGAGDSRKNINSFLGPRYIISGFILNSSWLGQNVALMLLTVSFPKTDSFKTLLTTVESKWKPMTKLPFLLPWHSLTSVAWAGIWDDSFR